MWCVPALRVPLVHSLINKPLSQKKTTYAKHTHTPRRQQSQRPTEVHSHTPSPPHSATKNTARYRLIETEVRARNHNCGSFPITPFCFATKKGVTDTVGEVTREAPGATHKKALWFRVYTNQVMCVCPRPRPRGLVSYICPDLPFKGGWEGRVQAATRRSTGRGCRVGGGRVRSLRRSVAVCLPAASSQEAGHRNLVCVHCNILIGLHADFLVGVGHPAGEGTRTKNSRIVAAEVGPGRPSELSSRGRLATPGWSCS